MEAGVWRARRERTGNVIGGRRASFLPRRPLPMLIRPDRGLASEGLSRRLGERVSHQRTNPVDGNRTRVFGEFTKWAHFRSIQCVSGAV